MLWRASQIFGHLHRAALQLAGRDPIFPPLLHTSIRIRCMSAALALQARAIFVTPMPQSSQPSPRTEEDLAKRSFGTKRGKSVPAKPRHSVFLSLPQPRPDLVKMVDALFERRRSGDYELERLKRCWENPEALSHLEDHKKARELAVLIVNTGTPYQACRVLLLAHSFGCTFKQSVYESVAYQMAQTGQWAEVPSLVALGRRQTGRTTARLLNWRARAILEVSHFGLLDRVLEQFEEEGIQPDRKTFHVLVSGHLRNRDLARVKECLGWMEDAGFPMDASTHALLVSNYRSLGSNAGIQKQALDSLQELDERNATAVINSLIQVSLDTRDIQSALKYLAFFDGSHPGTTDTPVLDGERLARGGRPGPGASKACPILSPDIATFTMLINYAARMRDHTLASQMLERLQSFAVVPDDLFVAAVIRFYCAVDDIHTALSITATACQHTPSALSYLRTLGLREQDTARQDLVPEGVGLTIRIVNALLHGVLTDRGLDGMRVILSLLHSVGLEPNDETVEIMMSHVSAMGLTRPRQLSRVLRVLPDHVKPTLRHIHILLRAIVGRQIAAVDPPGWGSIVNAADDTINEPPPPASTSTSGEQQVLEEVAKAILRHRPPYRFVVRRLVQSLGMRRISPDRATMHLAIRHEALVNRNMTMARRTLRIMLERGMDPNEYHYAAIIEGFSLSGHARAAEKVLWRAREAGFGRDPVLFTILIHAYGRLRQPHESVRIFKAMTDEGVKPDVGSINALAGAYYTVRSWATARRILVNSWGQFAPFPSELETADLRTLAEAFRKLSPQQPIRLSKAQQRNLHFRLKRVAQNDRRRRLAVVQKRRRKREKAKQHSGDVLDGTSANKHTIIQ